MIPALSGGHPDLHDIMGQRGLREVIDGTAVFGFPFNVRAVQ